MVSPSFYLTVSLLMFCIGALGMVIRKNALVLFMCVELMLNAVNLAFVTFGRVHGNLQGDIAVFFVMVVAAVEAAVGLAIIIAVFRNTESVETQMSAELRG